MKFMRIVAAAALFGPPALAFRPETLPAPYVAGEVLVKYRDSGVLAKARRDLGLTRLRQFERLGIEHLRLPSYLPVPDAVALLRADPAVAWAEPNFRRRPRTVVPNDPLFNQQWGLRNNETGAVGADLNVTEAWDANGDGVADRTGSPAIIVAVIDDSVDTQHEDLAANLVPGYDFACNDGDPGPNGDDFHGTLVSGCAVGIGNNAIGVAGVAWHASLMPLRFGFDEASHLEAIEFARANGAKIINASFGGPGFSQAEQDAITNLADDDILYVAAGGNDDSNTDLGEINYPANLDAENIVAVAATNHQDNIASFSQYGSISMDVAAPGRDIVTTKTGGGYSNNPSVSGTSFASPYAAGVAALLKSHVTPTPGWAEIKARLIESGSAVGDANSKLRTAGGRIDADLALEMSPRPALVIRSVQFENGDGNGALDPGETLDVVVGIKNLWQPATSVTATLDGGSNVTVNSGTLDLGTVGQNGNVAAGFSVTVAPGIGDHRYVEFTLTLTADGGYTATRGYVAEIGALIADVPVDQPFAGPDALYDEFHAWHFGVPAATINRTLVLRTHTDLGRDIDLLAKMGVPPQYNITLGIGPEATTGFFCTSGTTPDCQDPGTEVSGRLDGDEAITVENPAPGTWHLVVANYAQLALQYTISAALVDGDLRPDPFSLGTRSGVAFTAAVLSDIATISGIDTPTFVTVAGGEYSVNGGDFTSAEGTIEAGDKVQVRAIAESDKRTQLTVGGVTSTFRVNPSSGGGGDDDGPTCPGPSGGGGTPGWSFLLVGLAAAGWRRRHAI